MKPQRHCYSSTKGIFYSACLLVILLAGCGASSKTSNGTFSGNESQGNASTLPVGTASTIGGGQVPDLNANLAIDPKWQPLIARLKAELPGVQVEKLFAGLDGYSSAPMATKIKELYKIKYGPKRLPSTNGTRLPVSSIYKGVVTAANVEKCKNFLEQNKAAFDLAEKRHNVPRETIVSLLLVETKLGDYMGNDNAFWSLASMAAATSADMVKDGLTVTIDPSKETWLQEKLNDKSTWAFKELKAFVVHCTTNSLDPKTMPGSVYGAIGICQFMPSNLAKYADDGDNDGKIDLFTPADAIASAAKYLSAHGWESESSFEAKRKVIRRYNNLTRYANTILAMSESLRTGTLLTAAPDAQQKAVAKKAAAQKNGTKKAVTKKSSSTGKQVKAATKAAASKPTAKKGQTVPQKSGAQNKAGSQAK